MKAEVLAFLNSKIREEHGSTVTILSKWTDANVDSFGSTMVFCDMDEKYECFDRNWLSEQNWTELTVESIVTRVINESPNI